MERVKMTNQEALNVVTGIFSKITVTVDEKGVMTIQRLMEALEVMGKMVRALTPQSLEKRVPQNKESI